MICRMRLEVDVPDQIAAECRRRAPDITWSARVSDALAFALRMPSGLVKIEVIE
jgi:hypothetical protein